MPFGSLAAGLAADRIGARWTVVCGGIVTILGVAWFARILPQLREEMKNRREANVAPPLPETG